jgi:hypothetical protein
LERCLGIFRVDGLFCAGFRIDHLDVAARRARHLVWGHLWRGHLRVSHLAWHVAPTCKVANWTMLIVRVILNHGAATVGANVGIHALLMQFSTGDFGGVFNWVSA